MSSTFGHVVEYIGPSDSRVDPETDVVLLELFGETDVRMLVQQEARFFIGIV